MRFCLSICDGCHNRLLRLSTRRLLFVASIVGIECIELFHETNIGTDAAASVLNITQRGLWWIAPSINQIWAYNCGAPRYAAHAMNQNFALLSAGLFNEINTSPEMLIDRCFRSIKYVKGKICKVFREHFCDTGNYCNNMCKALLFKCRSVACWREIAYIQIIQDHIIFVIHTHVRLYITPNFTVIPHYGISHMNLNIAKHYNKDRDSNFRGACQGICLQAWWALRKPSHWTRARGAVL